jgi:hypothetical protein
VAQNEQRFFQVSSNVGRRNRIGFHKRDMPHRLIDYRKGEPDHTANAGGAGEPQAALIRAPLAAQVRSFSGSGITEREHMLLFVERAHALTAMPE